MPAWFKLHHELLRDKKLRLMASELKMPPALVRGLWVDLLCFAQELDQDGYLRLDHEIPLTWELVCEELGTTDDDAKKREEEKRNARTRATPVDNSTYPGSRTRYCPCGAELHPVGDGTAELHCPVCEPAEVTK